MPLPTPAVVNNAANSDLYQYGNASHTFGSRVWVRHAASAPTTIGDYTEIAQCTKADFTPGDTEKREVTHLLSPDRSREYRGSWTTPGTYDFEFNYTAARFAQLNNLGVHPGKVDEGHTYLVVEAEDGSTHELYGFFHPPQQPTRSKDAGDMVIKIKYESCRGELFHKSA